MFAIVFKADGFPVCRQVPGISPDPIVTWNSEAAAQAFISSKGGEADFQPVRLTDDAMDQMEQAMGCPIRVLTTTSASWLSSRWTARPPTATSALASPRCSWVCGSIPPTPRGSRSSPPACWRSRR